MPPPAQPQGAKSRIQFYDSSARSRALTTFRASLGGRARTPARPSTSLRGFDGAFAFQTALTAHVYLNLLRLGFGLLCQLDLQHALLIVGLDVIRINCAREREAAGEAAILPLDPAIVLFLLFLFEVALAVNGQVLFSIRTSMSFSSIPGTSIFNVTLCSSS